MKMLHSDIIVIILFAWRNGMKIIIAGAGKVGASLTKQLSSEGYDITLIDFN